MHRQSDSGRAVREGSGEAVFELRSEERAGVSGEAPRQREQLSKNPCCRRAQKVVGTENRLMGCRSEGEGSESCGIWA